VTFSAPAAEAADNEAMNELVTAVSPTTDSFTADDIPTGTLNTYNYDSGDLFLIAGVPSDMTAFEAALTVGDTVGGVYRAGSTDQSTFNITNDTDPGVTVVNPAAATSTTASTYTITGTGIAGYVVSIYNDADNLGDIDAGTDFKQAEVTVAADGTWSATVNLTAGVANNFTANQRAVAGDPNGTPVDVPTITQGAVAGVTITGTVANNVGVAGLLSPSDTIAITFSGAVTGVGNGDTITVLDADGSTAVLICGTNVTCVMSAGDTVLTLTVTAILVTTGNPDGIETQATIQAVTGFTSLNGTPVNVTGSGAGRTFAGF
jgi:hypothetical protein